MVGWFFIHLVDFALPRHLRVEENGCSTPLSAAAEEGNVAVVKLLATQRANVKLGCGADWDGR